MRGKARRTVATIGVGLIAMIAAGCGSSGHGGSSGNSGSGSSGGGGTTSSSATMSGAGYNVPTKPSGTRIKGGTVTFAEAPQSPPNYIFPMTSFTYCSTSNSNQLFDMMVRPLYWFGNNYSPTVDYNYSIGQKPSFTDKDKTVTIKMNHWMWSNGTPVTARDVLFWLHMYQADPTANYCGAVPGFFPQNVTSASAPSEYTLVLHLNRSYDPEWFQYNELSQLTPLPLAWDRTSLSQKAPTNPNAKLPDDTKSGAEAVYKFLDAQSRKPAKWASSPLWSIVDGPFRLQSYTTAGQVTLVPNSKYSGSPKPSISKLVELPYTSDTAAFNQERSGGPSAVTIGGLPQQDIPQLSKLTSAGYIDNKASGYEFNYFPINLHNKQVGPVFSQLYFRQAMAHLIDQPGWVKAFLGNTAVQTYDPIPTAPKSPLVNYSPTTSPFPFSTSAAATLLKNNGWNVKPGGTTTCAKPGTGSGECGAGIKSGEGISFNVDYMSGVEAIQSEMNDLQAEAKKVGISINLTEHPFSDVIAKAIPCTSGASDCKWTAENWGAGWIYGPDYLPTGETLYGKGASSNAGSYYTPEAQKLINKTVYGPLSGEQAALTSFAKYIAQQVPVLYGPTSIGTFQSGGGTMVSNKLGGYSANAMGFMTPEQWYLTK